MTQPPSIRRGFATITALALTALLGTSFTIMTLNFTADAHRTAKEATDAQLRQLLFAASTQARQTIDRGERPAAPVSVPLPHELIDRGAETVIHFSSKNQTAAAQINAKFQTSHATAQLQK